MAALPDTLYGTSTSGATLGRSSSAPSTRLPKDDSFDGMARIIPTADPYGRGASAIPGATVTSSRTADTGSVNRTVAPSANPGTGVPTNPYLGSLQGPGISQNTLNASAQQVQQSTQNPTQPYFNFNQAAPVATPDGGMATATPSQWGAIGFDPYMTRTLMDDLTGTPRHLTTQYLSEQGARKVAELLGINPTAWQLGSFAESGTNYNQPGTMYGDPNNPQSWKYYDPQAPGTYQDLAMFAPYLINNGVDVAKFMWDNRNNANMSNLLGHMAATESYTNSPIRDVASLSSYLNSSGINSPSYGTVPTANGGNNQTQPPGGSGGNNQNNSNAYNDLLAMLTGLWGGVNPSTVSGNFAGVPGGMHGQDVLDGLNVADNYGNLGEILAQLLSSKQAFDLSPTGLYAALGPAAYTQRQLYPTAYY